MTEFLIFWLVSTLVSYGITREFIKQQYKRKSRGYDDHISKDSMGLFLFLTISMFIPFWNVLIAVVTIWICLIELYNRLNTQNLNKMVKKLFLLPKKNPGKGSSEVD